MSDNASRIKEKAKALYRLKKYDDAIKYFLEYLGLVQNDIDALNTIAICFFRKKNLDEAQRFLNIGIKIDPTDSYNYYLRSSICNISGDLIKAEEYIQTAIRYNTNEPSYFIRYASIAFKKNDFEQMYKMSEKALQLNPEEELAYICLSDSYKYRGHLPKALTVLKDGIKTNPNSAIIHHSLGNIYLELNDIENANVHLTTAVRIDPESQGNINQYEFVKSVKDTLTSDDYYDVRVRTNVKKRNGIITGKEYNIVKKDKENFKNPFTILFIAFKIIILFYISYLFLSFGFKTLKNDQKTKAFLKKELIELKGKIDSINIKFIPSNEKHKALSSERLEMLSMGTATTSIHLKNDTNTYYSDYLDDEFIYYPPTKYHSHWKSKECTILAKHKKDNRGYYIYSLKINNKEIIEPGEVDKRYSLAGNFVWFLLSVGFIFAALPILLIYFLLKNTKAS